MSTYREPLERMCAFVFKAFDTGANTSPHTHTHRGKRMLVVLMVGGSFVLL